MHPKKTWECEQLAAFVATTLVLANYSHVRDLRNAVGTYHASKDIQFIGH